MRPRDVLELLVLSVLWGAAYLFTRSAVPAFGPVPLVTLRFAMAVAVLLPVLWLRGGLPVLAQYPRQLLIVGVPLTALPFTLLSWGALHLGAGLVAVLTATAPMFAALIAHFVLKDRLDAWRAVGLVVGLAGVALLMWGNVSFSTGNGVLALAAILATAMLWSVGATYTKRQFGHIDPVVTTFGSLGAACLFLAPLAWLTWPAAPPSARAWIEMAFLGVASSGLGMLMYFRLLRRIGPVRAMSVTFLSPLVAMVSGALYLGESLTVQMFIGAAVVLLGTALSLGLIGRTTPKAVVTSAA